MISHHNKAARLAALQSQPGVEPLFIVCIVVISNGFIHLSHNHFAMFLIPRIGQTFSELEPYMKQFDLEKIVNVGIRREISAILEKWPILPHPCHRYAGDTL